MRCVIQVVENAVVSEVKTGNVVGELLNEGFFVLLGIGVNDTASEADMLAKKISNLRILHDESGKMNKSVLDKNAGILVVSQFTLYADTKGGNRPSFLQAALPEQARELYLYFIEKLKSFGINVSNGSFGNEMRIKSILHGPSTIILDSKDL